MVAMNVEASIKAVKFPTIDANFEVAFVTMERLSNDSP